MVSTESMFLPDLTDRKNGFKTTRKLTKNRKPNLRAVQLEDSNNLGDEYSFVSN